MPDPLLLWSLAEEVLAAVEQSLGVNAVNPPGRVYVSPGAPPADSPCDGQLTVHLEDVFPTTTFPIDDPMGRGARCAEGTLAAVYVITLYRCVSTAGEEGDTGYAPAAADLMADAQQVLLDEYAIMRGLRCLVTSWDDEPEAALGHVTTNPVQGDAVWIEGRVTVNVTDCLCDDAAAVDRDLLLPGVIEEDS